MWEKMLKFHKKFVKNFWAGVGIGFVIAVVAGGITVVYSDNLAQKRWEEALSEEILKNKLIASSNQPELRYEFRYFENDVWKAGLSEGLAFKLDTDYWVATYEVYNNMGGYKQTD